MHERLRIFCYSMLIGAVLTPVAGWAGAVFFPELVLMSLFIALIGLLVGSFGGLAFAIFAPVYFGVVSGAWIVTLVMLPLITQFLSYRPIVLQIFGPLLAALTGYMLIKLDPVEASKPGVEIALRFPAAGAFAGFVVGAIHSRAMHTFLRDGTTWLR